MMRVEVYFGQKEKNFILDLLKPCEAWLRESKGTGFFFLGRVSAPSILQKSKSSLKTVVVIPGLDFLN